jgi:hypothetical protein
MAYVWQRWMVSEFRAAGLEVIVVDGWENRGRPASTGHYDPREGVTNHHTGATSSPSNPGPTLQTLITGRPDLPGPLAPWSVRYDGVVVVIAGGRCNHAGRVGKPVPFAVIGADGNAIFMGDEIDTNGTQQMPAAQRHAVAVTNRVYLEHFNRPVERVHRHADISGTGKWDLGSLTTQQLRDDVQNIEEDIVTEDDIKKIAAETAKATVQQLLAAEVGEDRSVRTALRMASKAPSVGRDLERVLTEKIQAAILSEPGDVAVTVTADQIAAAVKQALREGTES